MILLLHFKDFIWIVWYQKNKRILWTRPNGQFDGYTHTDAYIHVNDPVYDVTHGIGLKWVRAHVRPTYDPSASFPLFHSELTPEPYFHSSMLDLLLDFTLKNVSPFSPLIFGSCCLHLCDLQSDWFVWTPLIHASTFHSPPCLLPIYQVGSTRPEPIVLKIEIILQIVRVLKSNQIMNHMFFICKNEKCYKRRKSSSRWWSIHFLSTTMLIIHFLSTTMSI